MNIDDYAKSILDMMASGDKISLDNFVPSLEHIALLEQLQGARTGANQELFDMLRGSKWLNEDVRPSLDPDYVRKHFTQPPEKK